MTTHTNPDEENNNEQSEDNCLQISVRLNETVNNLRVLPEFRTMAQEKGEDAATMAIIKLLRETRPELFDSENPADGLALLYGGME
jgi:hypothetical protein